jgi:protein SCO1/2
MRRKLRNLQRQPNRMKNIIFLLVLFSSLVTLARQVPGVHLDQPKSLVSTEKPAEFEGIGITENLGQKLDLSMQFTDENGELVTLGKYFDGKHPVSISLIYYSCPGLCNFHLNGVIDAIKTMDWSPGDKFQLLAISFDPKETFETAALKRQNYIKDYNRPGTEKGFHFLTATQETIDKITQQIGFKYKWNESAKEWAHASAAVIVTPDGVISRYLHGIQFDSPTFKMALNEATNGKIGSLVDKMIWYCFKYDPQQSKYVLYAFRAMQFGAIAIVLLLAALILPVWLRGRFSR